MNLVTIRNTSQTEQIALLNGQQHVLNGGSERLVPEEIAQAFISQSDYVERVILNVGNSQSAAATSTSDIWLANMTGNPDAPEEVEFLFYDKASRGNVRKKVDNPLKRPRYIREKFNKGYKERDDGNGGKLADPLGFESVDLPPYSVRSVPAHLANWLLARDGNCEPINSGKIAISRPMPAFWPTEHWDYTDIQGFLQMHSPSANLGPNADEYDKMTEIDQVGAKNVLLQRLFFIFADRTRQLRGRKEFDEFMAAKRPNPEEVKSKTKELIADAKKK